MPRDVSICRLIMSVILCLHANKKVTSRTLLLTTNDKKNKKESNSDGDRARDLYRASGALYQLLQWGFRVRGQHLENISLLRGSQKDILPVNKKGNFQRGANLTGGTWETKGKTRSLMICRDEEHVPHAEKSLLERPKCTRLIHTKSR